MWENIELITPTTRGFLYLIINLTNNKLYIGKKKTITERRVKVKGRTNRKRVSSPSNWQLYYSSCKELLEDVDTLGKDKFRRVILGAYNELHTVNYGEAELQFLKKVLDTKGDFEWYNKNIKITTMKEPADRDYISRLEKVLREMEL